MMSTNPERSGLGMPGVESSWPELPALSLPAVSIVVCNYNGEQFLKEALESAMGQSYPCEVIVVDDGSTDGSRDILRSWGSRATIILQENGGQRAAYNTGFEACQGEVVVFLDSDDLLDQTAVEQIVAGFESGVAKVHCRLRLIDQAGRTMGGGIPATTASGTVARDLIRHGILYPSAPASGNAYRRDVLDRLFPLPLDVCDKYGADMFTVYGSCLFGNVLGLESTLGSYRIHEATAGPGGSPLAFGNAARRQDEVRLFHRRARSFRKWITQRTGGSVSIPSRLYDFSMEKLAFARSVFEAEGYLAGVRDGSHEIRAFFHSLWLRRQFSYRQKIALTGWALFVLLGPRRLGLPLAEFVCNPASRRSA